MNKGYFLNVDLSLIIALIIFTLSGFFLLPYYQYQINPEDIVYINIAKAYFNGNIATNDNDKKTLYLSYYLGTNYSGQTRKEIDSTKLQEELKKYDIDYYIVWGDSNNHDFLLKYEDITGGNVKGLKIYSMKDKIIS
ncbi:MAG: hypothetical protein PQ963_09810 [Methanobacterium sp.]